tara:strand:+ start:1759 stop:2136 length:378 start_codon:yes stop_codon:yes gene_type:complete
MYSKDMLIGIFLSHAGYYLIIEKRDLYKLGYSSKLKIRIGGKEEFLQAVCRSLLQHGVDSVIYPSVSHLEITSFGSICKVMELLPDVPDSKDKLKLFRELVRMFKNKEHLTLEGLEMLMEIKGVI